MLALKTIERNMKKTDKRNIPFEDGAAIPYYEF